jgi:hypothetical protein
MRNLASRTIEAVSANGILSDDGLPDMASIIAIEHLGMHDRKQMSNIGLRTLAGLTALTSLNLAWCENMSYDGMRTLSRLTALNTLNLSGCKPMLKYTDCVHWSTSQLLPASTCHGVRKQFRMTCCAHWLAILPSPTSTCKMLVVECRTTIARTTGRSRCPHHPQLVRSFPSVCQRVAWNNQAHCPHQPRPACVRGACIGKNVGYWGARIVRPHFPHHPLLVRQATVG